MLTLSPFHKKLALIAFFAAYILAGLGVVVKLYLEFSQPPPPNKLDSGNPLPLNLTRPALPARRPRFSERTDNISLLIASNKVFFNDMASGRRVDPLGGQLISARLVNNELVIDASLGSMGAEIY